MKNRILLITAMLLFLMAPTLKLSSYKDYKLHLEMCYVDELQETVRCGWLQVMENREVRKGRKIKVHFNVLMATGGTSLPDPIITFAGGPGGAATEGVVRWARQFDKFRQNRDIILIDQRGTGESNPLPCRRQGDPNKAQTWLGDMYTKEYVEKCKEELEKHADLRFDHTSLFVEDVDDLREALGYDRLNIMTGSYGTRVAIAYMQRYPERVRSAFLWSCNTTDMRYPTYLAPMTQASLEKLFAACEADPNCSADYPHLRQDFQDVLAILKQGPVSVAITNPFTGHPETVFLSYYAFVSGLRSMLYSDSLRSWIPIVIYWSVRGIFSPIAEYTAEYWRDTNETLYDGMYLCVTCTEDVSRMDYEEAAALAAGTFMETFRIDQQKMACDLWPKGDVPEEFFYPQALDIPTLILSGEVDPVTPPLYGDIVASFLPNSMHVVVPKAGHGINPETPWWKDGFDDVALQFIQQASVLGLDPSYVYSYTPPPFVSWQDFSTSTDKLKVDAKRLHENAAVKKNIKK